MCAWKFDQNGHYAHAQHGLLCLLVFTIFATVVAAETSAAPQPDSPDQPLEVPLTIRHERVFITVRFDAETECACMIDTGAEVSLINKARVKVKDLRVVGTEQLQGTFVGSVAAQKVLVPNLQIGARAWKHVSMRVLEHGAGQKLEQVDMLLGMDFLARTRFTLDFARERLILWPFRAPLPEPAPNVMRERLPLRNPAGDPLPRVEATVNGKKRGSFLVDSGAGGPIFVALGGMAENGFEPAGAEVSSMQVGAGSNRKSFPVRDAVFKRVELGRLVLDELRGRVVDVEGELGPVGRDELQAGCNVLGTPVLRRMSAVHFDLPGKCLYFEQLKPAAAASPKP